MPRLKLGEILVQNQVIDEPTLRRALGSQARFAGQKIRLGQILVDMGAAKPSDIAKALSQQLNIPLADLSNVNTTLVARVPEELCRKHQVVAFALEPGPPEAVRVAFFDPTDLAAVDAIRFKLGKPIRVAIGAGDAISDLIEKAYGVTKSPEPEALDLGEMLFSDSEAMAVEHYDASQPLAVSSALEIEPLAAVLPDVFQPGDAPRPVTPPPEIGAAMESAPAPDLNDSLSDLFGELNSDLGLDAPPAAASPPPAAKPLSFDAAELAPPPVEITRFPDRRKRESAPKPPPAPKLVLTTQAFFSPPPPPFDPARTDGPEGDLETHAPGRPVSDPLAEIMAGVEIPPDGPGAVSPEANSPSLEFDPDQEPGGEGLFGAAEVVGAPAPPPEVPLAGDDWSATDFTAPAAPHLEVPSTGGELFRAEAAPLPSAGGTPPVSSPPAEEPTEVDDADLEPILEDQPIGAAPAASVEPEPLRAPIAPAPLADEVDSWADSTGNPKVSSVADEVAEPQPPLEDLSIDFSLDEGEPSPAAPSGKLEALAVYGVGVEPVAREVPSMAPVPLPSGGPAPTPMPAEPVEAVNGPGEALPALAAFANRPLTEEDLSILTAIERLADGLVEEPEIRQVKPAHMVAALVRLLIRKGIIQETDFLAELSQK